MDLVSPSLSQEFRSRLLAFVRRYVRAEADAEDVVQDVFTKLVLRGPAEGSVHAWLFTVARNAIIDRSRTRRLPVYGEVEVVEPAAEEGRAQGEVARCLSRMMATLSDEDRHILERIDLGGESQTNLAREMGLSVSGVKSRVQRARGRLRAALEGCCDIARDARGAPIDCQPRPATDCGCSGPDSTC